MKPRELDKLGLPKGPIRKTACAAIEAAAKARIPKAEARTRLSRVLKNPDLHAEDPIFGALAQAVLESREGRGAFVAKDPPAPFARFGEELDPAALAQMERAVRLPIAVRGAVLPDAHVGYGLPIGGVLATEGAVIPYAVGMDIACRMKLSVLDLPLDALALDKTRLIDALNRETRFGVGAQFGKGELNAHPVMDEDWGFAPLVKKLKPKAARQLGTSGSGNHFVEFGVVTVKKPFSGLVPGRYAGLLSHSGSRGPGGEAAGFYSRLAMERNPHLPKEFAHLAWFDVQSAEGLEYWATMELLGRFAQANHALIHERIAKRIKAGVLASVENHHNFAWKEVVDGRERIVHRKGATPAGAGALGVIPGSMTQPGYVVQGLGSAASLNSSSHGAGRAMSRGQARQTYRWKDVAALAQAAGVELVSAGLDEIPLAYKDIGTVMAAQTELVEILARFNPKIVKMAPDGDRPED